MKRAALYLSILLFPLLFIVVVNESARAAKNDHYTRKGATAINATTALVGKCSWACHDNTDHCKNHHVSFLKEHYATTDPLYFGVINSLQSTGSYGLANILLLVVLVPGLIYLLLIKSISLQFRIKALKKEQDAADR